MLSTPFSMQFANTLMCLLHYFSRHFINRTPPINCQPATNDIPPLWPSFPIFFLIVSDCCTLLLSSAVSSGCVLFIACDVNGFSWCIRLLFVDSWQFSAKHRCCVSTVFMKDCMRGTHYCLSSFPSTGNKWLRCGARICSYSSILWCRCFVLLLRLEGFVDSFNCIVVTCERFFKSNHVVDPCGGCEWTSFRFWFNSVVHCDPHACVVNFSKVQLASSREERHHSNVMIADLEDHVLKNASRMQSRTMMWCQECSVGGWCP